MQMREITIDNAADWAEFCAINPDAIDEAGGEEAALTIACQGGLECGGGAAPLTIVFYVDDAVQARIDAAWLVA